MPEYINKSFEELRWEDTELGQTSGDVGAGAGGFGAVNTTTTGGGLFGAAPTTAAPATGGFGGFGAPAATGFGASTGASFGGFGQSAPATTTTGFGGFGASTGSSFGTGGFGASTGGGFGTTAAPATTSTGFGGFGSAATTSSFGAPATTGGFGSTGGGFGGGAFGATTSGFGASTSASLFGGSAAATTTTGFGSGFGASTGGGFGTGFGTSTSAPATTSFAFPSAASTGGSLFGGTTFGAPTSSAASSSFSFGAAAPTTTGGGFGTGGFGAAAPTTTGGLFGSTSTGAGFGSSTFGSTFGAPATTQPQQIQQPVEQHVAKVDENPFLANFLTTSSQQLHKTAVGLSQSQALLSVTPSATLTSLAPSTSSALTPGFTPSRTRTPFGSAITPRSAARLKPRRYLGSPAPLGTLTPSLSTPAHVPAAITPELLVSRRNLRKLSSVPLPEEVIIQDTDSTANPSSTPQAQPLFLRSKTHLSPTTNATIDEDEMTPDFSRSRSNTTPSTYPKLNTSNIRTPFSPPSTTTSHAPILTRPDYHTIPSMKELQKLSFHQLQSVHNFTVVHEEYGKIIWEGSTDVADLNLDELVIFERSSDGAVSAEVYPSDTVTPPLGSKLNKPAVISIHQCWPMSNPNETDARKWLKYERNLQEITQRAGAQFISYEREGGIWTFRVNGFT